MVDKEDPFKAIRANSMPTGALINAEKEEKALAAGRTAVQGELHVIARHALRYGAFLIAVMVTIRFWHVAGPYSFFGWEVRWLSDVDLQSMDKMLFSSAFGGLVLGYLKEIMAPAKRE
ncbi:hypothetical protein [Pseudomonas sp. UBA4194]|uniref:hypothetical protein n=1 Tax=Pseudomonas sp. UBA4194 TaxID=1947317 RepID=UPI0025FF3057|nr:hypothetical protein [Pseudomonas sp. UBA4194]